MSESKSYALTMAYRFVICLGWTHKRLFDEFGINHHTLQRVRDGLPLRQSNEKFLVKTFIRIADEAYQHDMVQNGGQHALEFLCFFHGVLMASMDVGE